MMIRINRDLISASFRSFSKSDLAEADRATALVHQLVQLIAASGRSYIPAREDDSHTSMTWVSGRLEGEFLHGNHPLRLALRLDPLQYEVRGSGGELINHFELKGRTLREALNWWKHQAGDLGLDPGELVTGMHYEIPSHTLVTGNGVESAPGSESVLVNYFNNATLFFEQVSEQFPESPVIRVWPHHFDVAILLDLGSYKKSLSGKTIGMGLAMKDDYYPVHYFYLTPWPRPDIEVLPEIGGGGHWFRGDWFGGVLPVSDLFELSGQEQVDGISEFAESGTEALLQI